MQNDHSNALRGLSIATIVVAGLCILACVIGFIALGVGGSALASLTPDMIDHYYDYDGYEYGYMMDDADMMAIMGLILGIGGFALFYELICSAVALIAGIFGLRFHDQREKMNMLFGWSLAGAIVSFLGGNIVCMVLLIIMTVFAYKDKQLATAQPVIAAPNASVSTAPAAPTAPMVQSAPTAQPSAQPATTGQAQPTAPAAQPTASEQASQPATADKADSE